MITDYKILFGQNVSELTGQVQKAIKEGYEPYGSPYATNDLQNGICHFQAVVWTTG